MKKVFLLRHYAIIIVIGFLLFLGLQQIYAIEIPAEGSFAFIQTSGPNAPLANGDYYTSVEGADEPHIIEFEVPCAWDPTLPLTVALFDPESQIPNPTAPSAIDQIRGAGPDTTTFTFKTPAGDEIISESYTPDGGTNGLWVELVTFQPNTPGFDCGMYALETTTSDDDEQSWRLRVGNDPDCTISTSGPGTCSGIGAAQSDLLNNGNETDNPDGIPGSGDELAIGLLQVSFEHSDDQCQNFFFFVGETNTINLHNFDMDGSGTITYSSPSGREVPGTVSAQTEWNNGSPPPPIPLQRVGDEIAIADGDLGWWQAEVCTGIDNQYIFEGQEGEPIFYQQPPTPVMTVTKDDGETVTSPNSTLTYVIEFANTSDTTSTPGAAQNVTLSDTLPPNASFVSCAIDAPFTGTCSAAGGVVTATINELVPAGESGSMRITVRVNPGATGEVVNEVTLNYEDTSGRRYPPERDDDIDIIVAGPAISASKSVVALNTSAVAPCEVFTDEVLEYTVEITNGGNAPATGVVFDDSLDPNTALVAGSVETSQGTVVNGSGPVRVDIGDLGAGESATITYRATVTGPLAGATDIVNQGVVTGDNFSPINTDDPTTATFGDPTTIVACPPPPAQAPPILEAGKQARALNSGATGQCQVLFGETLEYTVIIANNGDLAALGVRFEDTPDANTQLVAGSVETSQGTVAQGNTAGDTRVAVTIGTIEPGQNVRISYRVTVNNLSGDQPVTLVNQGRATGDNVDPVDTDDPSTPEVGDPTRVLSCPTTTAVVLERFTATHHGDTVVVHWTTSAEINTWGFHLYRSSDGQREHAERITPEMILARGRGQDGASYTWTDSDVNPGTAYTYWLQEIEVDGATHEYGPADTSMLAADRIVFLPIILR